MSTAIPWLIKPIVFNDRLFVDGALMNGYPINYFKKEIDKTLGIVLLEENYKDIKTINSLEQYSLSIVMCQTMHQKKKMYEKYKNNSILISSNSNLNNFSFKKGDKEGLIDNGYECTIDYFENGFFDKFINEIDTDNNEKELLEDNLLDEEIQSSNQEQNSFEVFDIIFISLISLASGALLALIFIQLRNIRNSKNIEYDFEEALDDNSTLSSMPSDLSIENNKDQQQFDLAVTYYEMNDKSSAKNILTNLIKDTEDDEIKTASQALLIKVDQ